MNKLISLSILVSFAVPGWAAGRQDLQDACSNEISLFCEGVRPDNLEKCLNNQPKGIMKPCRTLLKSLLEAKAAPAALAAPGAAQDKEVLGQGELKSALNSGIKSYMGGDYKTASENFERVLASEKKQRTLTDRMLIPVIDNLGVSYGQIGNFTKSQETLDYGLSLFPAHTPFNYNKACGYGETGDMKSALAELQKAYDNNPRLKPYLPNAAQDPSFAKFRSDPAFKKFLERNSIK
jgi:tetratricopeptide (TPR) repeat protein